MIYDDIINANKEWVDEVFEKLDTKLSRTAVKSRYKIPYTTVNGVHNDMNERIQWWTNGFWAAIMWIMYAETKKDLYKETADVVEKSLDRVFEDATLLDHDSGFIWHLSAGASYKLTGSKVSRNRNLLAAMSLASRYNIKANMIRAWNDPPKAGWSIIDCMMNIPQLYWASDELGDDRFNTIALRFADMAMKDHVRPDGSVNHIVSHDLETGEVIETFGGQGYEVGSCWSRGDAWALYGFVLSYIHTKKVEYLDTAKKVAHYFIANLAANDWLPVIDFRQPEEPMKYDSTAGAIAACGLIEIAKNVPENEKKMYLSAAIKLLKAMEKVWCNWEENEDSILQMGSGAYSGQNHMPIIYGDYFFAEAILKLKGSDFLPW